MNNNVNIAINWAKTTTAFLSDGGQVNSFGFFSPFNRNEQAFIIDQLNKHGISVKKFANVGAVLTKNGV